MPAFFNKVMLKKFELKDPSCGKKGLPHKRYWNFKDMKKGCFLISPQVH